MTQTTWDPNADDGIPLSNGDATGTGPGTTGALLTVYATNSVLPGEKAYFEVATSGFYPDTAFEIGVAAKGWNEVTTSGATSVPSNPMDIGFHWDGPVVDEGGTWIYNPNITSSTPLSALQAAMQNGGTLDVAVDRVDNQIWFRSSLNGLWNEDRFANPATDTGGFSIAAMGSKPLFPFMQDWIKPGAVGTINGGSSTFSDGVPAGFTSLDNLNGGSSGGSGGDSGNTPNTITVNQPVSLVAGEVTFTGSETDPTQPVFLDWRTHGAAPSVGASDAVQAAVNAQGNFSATLDIDHAGTQSTMYAGSSGVLAAAWAATPVGASSGGSTLPTVMIGSGPDTLALQVSEDALDSDAQFTVSVDGAQIGGTQTTTASHANGQTQKFDVMGSFAAGSHTATIDLLNGAQGGASGAHLYVAGATIDDSMVPTTAISEFSQGPQSFTFLAPGNGPSNAVMVDQPTNLAAAVQSITGIETDPTQAVFLDWHTYGTPATNATDWVQATVNANGQFSATISVDHPGMQSTMFYHTGSGLVTAAWSGVPS